MHEAEILKYVLIVLACALPFALLMRGLGQSTVAGYLVAGLVIGPGGLKLIPKESIHILAEIGVGLLLFEIGIELSIEKLVRMRRIALGGGALQVFGTTLVAALAVYALTGHLYEGIFVGCAVALSSSAIVLKTLADRDDLASPHGNAATGVAIFQDLATVPMMVVLPVLGAGAGLGAAALPVLIAIGKAAGLLVVLAFGSRFLIDPLLYRVGRARSPEIFVIAVIVLVIGAALGSAVAGLSLALGAFIAGLLLSESKYAHQILAEVTPFKGVFQAVFFVSIGMLLDPQWMLGHMGIVTVALVAVLVGKTIVCALALVAVGAPARVAVATGILLSQVGEFSFILIDLGRRRQLIDFDHYQLTLAASFLSMAIAPLLIANVRRVLDGLARLPVVGPGIGGESKADAETEAHGLTGHLVLCGFGPIGREVEKFARKHSVPHVVIELNPKTVKEAGARGVPIFFGDFANPRVLEHAGIRQARAFVVTAPDTETVRRAIQHARTINPEILIVARARYHGQATALVKDGATDVVEEEFQTAVELVARLGLAFGFSRPIAVEDMMEQKRETDAEADGVAIASRE